VTTGYTDAGPLLEEVGLEHRSDHVR